MNPRINYSLVGAFVLLLLALALALVVWLSRDQRDLQRISYVTYFSESVAGLNERANVRFLGVPVGIVERIQLDPEQEGRVRLDLRIDAQVPIRESSVATLQTQGITGLLFVEISSGDPDSPRILTESGSAQGTPAVIRSQPSRLLRVTEALNETLNRFNHLADNLNLLTEQLSRFTDAQMRDEVAEILFSLRQLLNTSEATLTALDPAVYRELALSLSRLSQSWAEQSEQLGDEMTQLSQTLIQQVESLGEAVQKMARDTQSGARQLTPVLSELNGVLELLRRDSSSWVRGSGQLPPGPGEE